MVILLMFFQTETYGTFTSIIFVFVSLVPYRLIEIERRRNSSLLGRTVGGPAEKLTIGINSQGQIFNNGLFGPRFTRKHLKMFLSRNISVTVGRRGNCVEAIFLNNHLTLFITFSLPPAGERKFLTTLQYIFSYSVIHLGFVFKSPPQYSLDYLYQIQLSPKEHHTAGPFPCKRR